MTHNEERSELRKLLEQLNSRTPWTLEVPLTPNEALSLLDEIEALEKELSHYKDNSDLAKLRDKVSNLEFLLEGTKKELARAKTAIHYLHLSIEKEEID